MILSIRNNHGLGNRIAALANALSCPEVELVRCGWTTNTLCPLHPAEVFPDGVPGVEFYLPDYRALSSRIGGVPSELWEAAQDRAKADAAYQMLMERMAGQAMEDAPEVAVLARFLPLKNAGCKGLAEAVPEGCRVFLLADSRRAEMTGLLAPRGVQVVLPASPEMPHEQQRPAAAMRAFLSDWKTLCRAEAIICLGNKTSLIYPARAAGKVIHCI